MNYEGYTAAIQDLLKEVNGSKGLDLELDPFWSYPILDARNTSLGYKVRSRASMYEGILSLAVDTLGGFTRSRDGHIGLTPTAKEQIVKGIKSFWGDGNAEKHTFIDVY
jgi:hypothetical protein